MAPDVDERELEGVASGVAVGREEQCSGSSAVLEEVEGEGHSLSIGSGGVGTRELGRIGSPSEQGPLLSGLGCLNQQLESIFLPDRRSWIGREAASKLLAMNIHRGSMCSKNGAISGDMPFLFTVPTFDVKPATKALVVGR